jgi:hypothetical protein
MAQQTSTRIIWETAEALRKKNPSTRRCDVISACLKKGIPLCTVMTQASAWVTARRVFTDLGFAPGLVGEGTASPKAKKAPKVKKAHKAKKAKKAPKAAPAASDA